MRRVYVSEVALSVGRVCVRACVVAAALSGVALVAPAQAQVMEIGEGGAVQTYSGPTVFNAQGATPIDVGHPQPAPRARRGYDKAAIAAAANTANLSPALVRAVAERESGFRADVVSKSGAIGEMQLMPGTARSLGVDPKDVAQNLRGGAAYLSQLMRRYDGDLVRTLAAYNAGPKAVDKYGGVPPFRETQAYVAAIMQRLSVDALASDATGIR